MDEQLLLPGRFFRQHADLHQSLQVHRGGLSLRDIPLHLEPEPKTSVGVTKKLDIFFVKLPNSCHQSIIVVLPVMKPILRRVFSSYGDV
jgi:hypothetical protein